MSGKRSAPEPFLLYDGECPFCSLYARRSRFETLTGQPLTLIDAGDAPDLVAELKRQGCDIEEGMILVLDGRRHQGADALMVLRSMTSGSDCFNRFARWFSSTPTRVRLVYPWFRRLRRAAVWVRRRINPSC